MPISAPDKLSVDWIVQQLIPVLLKCSYEHPIQFQTEVPPETVLDMLKRATEVLAAEVALLELQPKNTSDKFIIFGDLHGQFHDLENMLREVSMQEEHIHLAFNGDFVDRGFWGMEILVLLAALKLAAPHRIYLIRGNHECSDCIRNYGFEREVKKKFPDHHAVVLKACRSLFSSLPLAARIGQSTLVLHGGLFRNPMAPANHGKTTRRSAAAAASMQVGTLDQLKKAFKGGTDPCGDKPRTIIATDVIWSDPKPDMGMSANAFRGIGVVFGPDVTQDFLETNKLKLIIRSHEGPDARERRPGMKAMDKGFSVDHNVTAGKLITVFSAPNYPQASEDRCDNQAAVVILTAPDYCTPDVQHFSAAPWPTEAVAHYL